MMNSLLDCLLVGAIITNTTTAHQMYVSEAKMSAPAVSVNSAKYKPMSVPSLPKTTYKTAVSVVKMNVNHNFPSKQPKLPKTFVANIPSSYKNKWVAYAATIDGTRVLYITVPKTFTPAKPTGGTNTVANDGSFELVLNGPGASVKIDSSSMSTGDSEAEAAPFFPSARSQIESIYGWKTTTAQQLGEKVTYPNSELALFGYKDILGNNIYGFNQYIPMDKVTNLNSYTFGWDFAADIRQNRHLRQQLL
ncbi:hypothetical protein [Alicyclobacillus acidoterrestris]|uniref:Uncharacterized protein n=1 Tax=Alicyclobacillus acidoterrestris (strain ATCC 49025 / DSM 3922 / CIP 106132 / NCIMB 13137 / GD3B) TaxID=1356854 RepID=T0DNK4_ALIAG|nr:hypothetical protein [Alicyclobacillus acidoterrestris]EPZ52957.1 hypothetical protein N007_18955 [Alicyclobacillus acidoterrestris ATCC 49025]UNO48250.1 hypothetical protein K1I37_16455 [Alicyclobacillus acidoterrestris]